MLKPAKLAGPNNASPAVVAHAAEPVHADCVRRPPSPCPQLPGTVLRVFIPAGAAINLLNLIEVDSPSGICLIVRLPFLGGGTGGFSMASLVQAVQQAGGTVEYVNQ